MGTPTPEIWPEVDQLEHWKETFPKWRAQNMYDYYFNSPPRQCVQELGRMGAALIARMLTMNPKQRMTSRRAKGHAFFERYKADKEQQAVAMSQHARAPYTHHPDPLPNPVLPAVDNAAPPPAAAPPA